jgi:GntR family transcriptional repressor for pyruvate dehydrogenase complex
MSSGLSKGRNAPKPAEAVQDRGVVEAPAEDHPVPAVRLYQQIADLIAASILDGTYKPGSRLPSERDLSEQLQVSRQTIREALIALEIRDFINVHHGSGIYVNKKPPVDIAAPELGIGPFEVTEARRLFESEACALAATVITDAELAHLEKLLNEIMAEGARPLLQERADRAFHIAIAKATRNSAIVLVVQTLWDLRYNSTMCRHPLARARATGGQALMDDHWPVFAALKARDPAAARAAMRDHLGRVIENLLAGIEADLMERARADVAARRREIALRKGI